MPRIRIVQFTLLAATWIATTAAGKVIGEDDRRTPGPGDEDLLSATGLVVCSSIVGGRQRRSAGTGTIIGNRTTVLTSAHVLLDEAGRFGPEVRFDALTDCVFRQYDASGEVRVEVTFSYAALGDFWRNPGMPNQDWAVLRTARPLPESSQALPFAERGIRIDELNGLSIRMLAFHADLRLARRLPMLSEGNLFGIDYGGFRRLAHDADSGRMSSGAAIVHRLPNGQHVVVGVNRSSANLRDFNIAVPLSIELVEVLKSNAFGQVPIPSQRLAYLGRGSIAGRSAARPLPEQGSERL